MTHGSWWTMFDDKWVGFFFILSHSAWSVMPCAWIRLAKLRPEAWLFKFMYFSQHYITLPNPFQADFSRPREPFRIMVRALIATHIVKCFIDWFRVFFCLFLEESEAITHFLNRKKRPPTPFPNPTERNNDRRVRKFCSVIAFIVQPFIAM